MITVVGGHKVVGLPVIRYWQTKLGDRSGETMPDRVSLSCGGEC